MFATASKSRRRVASRVHFEALDARTLMSVTVPTGYVQVDHLTLDAYTLAPQNFTVVGGNDYFFKATGKHVLAQNPTRYADAGSYQPGTTSWINGTHLHVRDSTTELASWGAHAADNEYGATYTAPSNLTLTAVITDSNRLDNLGSLDLYIYERVDDPMGRAQGGGDDQSAVGRAPTSDIFSAETDPIAADFFGSADDPLGAF